MGWRTSRFAAAGLPRHRRRPVRRGLLHRNGRGRGPRILAHLLCQSVNRLLKPGGKACIQSIVIDDSLFERYISSTDFIQQYIFPGGCLPCPREFRREAEAAGLRVVDEFAFGQDYAETLKRWRERFLAQRAQILQLGFDQRFMHIWEFYLAYCEAAFAMRNIDLVQYTWSRRDFTMKK
jgi:cyclopropane-fatty-acyl-phospholipid synthase